ncbi:NAD(P)/FAD-dependent oxidoreductase [Aquincola tertiaricarbonis]|uniref:NAD(P)/FAD-dependent oxidoreductase n=1 Tax=Aquincola tertiaricarbonis TaxID=391953 RepID=A0ABY4S124_AQUTE|nr:FAD/NAD(P)-binding oxidoreductase [Aquincola tertiaricarbonis]URI06568.1 NAD(P)/FAD-dependent oxidoreductase [Aquincola tertiaricarbonis]
MSAPLTDPKLPPVVVGAGPAGVRAVQALVAHGLRPVWVDEAPRGGGQIYRQPPPGFTRPAKALYGFEAGRAQALHATLAALLPQVDHRPDTLVWHALPAAPGQPQAGTLSLLHGPAQQQHSLPFGQLLLATGATDRVLPMPGWTLPGVFSLGGAQVALKSQACAIGQRVVFIGTGPLLYLVAWQYMKAGVQVAAVLDNARLADQVAALPDLALQPVVLAKGAWFVAQLAAAGVPVHRGARALRLLPDEAGERLQAVVWTDGVREHTLACDGAALGHGLRSETQLADLLGCAFEWQPLHRAWLPRRDEAGRASARGVYLAGDGAGILGADAAEWAGERAALAMLADRGIAVDAGRVRWLQARLARSTRFRQGLERAFPLPPDWAAQVPDETVICRCEHLTAGELRRVAQDTGAAELSRLKALSRLGMGRCQGRMCGAAAAELLAQATHQPVERVGRLRAQAPVKPIPLLALPVAAAESGPAEAHTAAAGGQA